MTRSSHWTAAAICSTYAAGLHAQGVQSVVGDGNIVAGGNVTIEGRVFQKYEVTVQNRTYKITTGLTPEEVKRLVDALRRLETGQAALLDQLQTLANRMQDASSDATLSDAKLLARLSELDAAMRRFESDVAGLSDRVVAATEAAVATRRRAARWAVGASLSPAWSNGKGEDLSSGDMRASFLSRTFPSNAVRFHVVVLNTIARRTTTTTYEDPAGRPLPSQTESSRWKVALPKVGVGVAARFQWGSAGVVAMLGYDSGQGVVGASLPVTFWITEMSHFRVEPFARQQHVDSRYRYTGLRAELGPEIRDSSWNFGVHLGLDASIF